MATQDQLNKKGDRRSKGEKLSATEGRKPLKRGKKRKYIL